MRTMAYVYHLGCFQCVMCGQPLQVHTTAPTTTTPTTTTAPTPTTTAPTPTAATSTACLQPFLTILGHVAIYDNTMSLIES